VPALRPGQSKPRNMEQSLKQSLAMRPRGLAELLCRPAVFAPLLLGLAVSISSWFANRGLPTSDEGAVLTWTAKILRGGVFYRDIDAYPMPGAAYFLALWMRLFGEHLTVARVVAAGVYCLAVSSLYFASLQLLDRPRAALFGLSLLSFKFLAFPAFTTYMYSDLSFCLACLAIALLLSHPFRGASIRLVLAGVLVGGAFATKQSLGIYLGAAAIAILLFPKLLLAAPTRPWRERWSEVAAFALGCVLSIAPIVGYFASYGLLYDAAYSSLARPLLEYLPTSGISAVEPFKWWEFGKLQDMQGFPYFVGPYWTLLMDGQLPWGQWYWAYWSAGEAFSRALYTSIPIAFIGAFALWVRTIRRGRASTRDTKIFALALLVLAVTLSAFPRADFFHVISIYPLILLLFFGLGIPAGDMRKQVQSRGRRPRIEACAVGALLLVTGTLSVLHHSQLSYRMTLPKADVYVSPRSSWVESIVKFIDDEVAPDERLFVYGHEAYYYFLTGRFFPWPFATLYPGQVGSDRGTALGELLFREPPEVVVTGLLSWPGVPDLLSYAPGLYFYVAVLFERDDSWLERYPPRRGGEVPPWALVLRRGEWACFPPGEDELMCLPGGEEMCLP
jgi:Dolichyl-phosphate-mannose-protein mannosyltransferase